MAIATVHRLELETFGIVLLARDRYSQHYRVGNFGSDERVDR